MSNIIQEMSTLSMKDYIIKNHELDKFKLLYLENAPRLIFYASKYVDSDTAEDLVHEYIHQDLAKERDLFRGRRLEDIPIPFRSKCLPRLPKA